MKAGKTCDTAKNTMLAELQEHETVFKNAKTTFDNIEEQKRIDEEKAMEERSNKILTKISWITGSVSRLVNKPAVDVGVAIVDLKADNLEWAEGREESTGITVNNVIGQLESLYTIKLENENAKRFAGEAPVKREVEQAKVEEAEQQAQVDKKEQYGITEELENNFAERGKETLKALAEILQNDKPAATLASDILVKVWAEEVPHLFFK